jgi:nucleoside 2-deoxyribosyltransferase
MKKLNIYLAGPLFTQAEIDQRKYEAKKLRELGYEVYSPIEQNADIGYDIDELYRRDIVAMTAADISVLCLDNLDSGTMSELGWFVAKGKPVFSHWTNWKYPEPDNLFIRGLALEGPNKLFKSLDTLLAHLAKYNQ